VRAVVLGRYSPAKGLATILRAVQQVAGVELDVHGAALSELERRHRAELERLGIPLGDAVPRAEVPRLLAEADVLVNNMEAGAPDKVVYEAAAACLPVLASNPVFDELFAGYPLSFDRESPESLAERLRWFVSLDPAERGEIGRALRERVAARHSVETWAEGVLAAA
jgi:glycosyltransferase involved in cell wall biosynthesis